MIATIDEVKALLARGKTLVLAGDETLLRAVPRGSWIGGTIPYFMTREGGVTSREVIYVEEIPSFARPRSPVVYDERRIGRIGVDAPDNGYTIVILPAFSALHQRYAVEAPNFKDIFLKTVAGWVSGVHLDDLGRKTPKTFNGLTGAVMSDRGVALHVDLPPTYRAQIGIVNIFEPGEGDEIRFPTTGFDVRDCMINGERHNFHDYFVSRALDTRLPLVASSCGATINVSIQSLDAAQATVKLYAPVFEGVPYRFARPIDSYPQRFAQAIPAEIADPIFTCNCVLNYVYGELENQHTGTLTGPMTFGEIAFQLLNQTLVHVTVARA
jgi:uncharacterized protein DUF6976